MPEISAPAITGQLLGVLREAFEGPERWSYFTDTGIGLFNTLEALTAEEAASPVGGTSIAAHARHILFALTAAADWIGGDRTPRDWRTSWHTDPVDEREWLDILDGLRDGYRDLRAAIEQHAPDSEESLGGALGAIAHTAYHLGAIRAKVVCGK
jgi:hypothetical protein